MQSTIRYEMTEAVVSLEEKPRDQWLFDPPAQVSQIPKLPPPPSWNEYLGGFTYILGCFSRNSDLVDTGSKHSIFTIGRRLRKCSQRLLQETSNKENNFTHKKS